MKNLGATIAKAQITNGGPIILVQPENEYTQAISAIKPFPDPVYFQYVIAQLRDVGIVVPLVNNDASAKGNNAPIPTAPGYPAAVDIYTHDGYPLGFDCVSNAGVRTACETYTDFVFHHLGEPKHMARWQVTNKLASTA
jgi:hypothetical protein